MSMTAYNILECRKKHNKGEKRESSGAVEKTSSSSAPLYREYVIFFEKTVAVDGDD